VADWDGGTLALLPGGCKPAAAEVARLAEPVRLGGLRQAVELDLRRAHRAGGDQLRDPFERRAGAADLGAQRGHVVAVRLRRLRARGDEGGAAAGPQHRERFLRHLTADGIEDGVAIIAQPSLDRMGRRPGAASSVSRPGIHFVLWCDGAARMVPPR